MPFPDTWLAGEPDRLAALRRYQLLDTEPERELEEAVQLATTIFGLPVAATPRRGSDRQWLKASAGLDVRETPRSLALCRHTIQGAAP